MRNYHYNLIQREALAANKPWSTDPPCYFLTNLYWALAIITESTEEGDWY